jgi:hypothetical protein
MFRMKLFLIMFVTALAIGCQSPANKDGVATATELKLERFSFKGKVVEITDKDKKKVKASYVFNPNDSRAWLENLEVTKK